MWPTCCSQDWPGGGKHARKRQRCVVFKGTRTPVRAIVEIWRQGVAPEEITRHLPHLTLARVFDALSYYSDHQDEINAHLERNRIPEELTDPPVNSGEPPIH